MGFDRLWQGVIDTFLMVGVSSLIALILGIPLAVILVTSGKGGIYEAPAINRALGAFVNLFRDPANNGLCLRKTLLEIRALLQ